MGTKKVLLQQLRATIREKKNMNIKQDNDEVLKLLNNFNPGAETMIIHLLYALTETDTPQPNLIESVKNMYKTHNEDAKYIVPILPALTATETYGVIPKLMRLPPQPMSKAIDLLIEGFKRPGMAASVAGRGTISPAKLLVQIHHIDPSKHKDIGLSMKHVLEMWKAVLVARKRFFSREVLANVLQQLVDSKALPDLFMRTAITSLEICPNLKEFVVRILGKVAKMKVWKSKQLWKGFVLCCKKTLPESLDVLYTLPEAALLDAFKISDDLRQHIRFRMRRASLSQAAAVPEKITKMMAKVA